MKTLAYTYYYNSVLASQESRMRKLLTEKGENKLCANYIGQLTVKYVCCLIPILWSIRVIHIRMSQRIFLNLLEECSSLIGTWRLNLQRILKGLKIGYLVEFAVNFSVGWMRIVIFLVLLYLVITSVAVYKFFKVTEIFHPVFLII